MSKIKSRVLNVSQSQLIMGSVCTAQQGSWTSFTIEEVQKVLSISVETDDSSWYRVCSLKANICHLFSPDSNPPNISQNVYSIWCLEGGSSLRSKGSVQKKYWTIVCFNSKDSFLEDPAMGPCSRTFAPYQPYQRLLRPWRPKHDPENKPTIDWMILKTLAALIRPKVRGQRTNLILKSLASLAGAGWGEQFLTSCAFWRRSRDLTDDHPPPPRPAVAKFVARWCAVWRRRDRRDLSLRSQSRHLLIPAITLPHKLLLG